jgi:plastocyanin
VRLLEENGETSLGDLPSGHDLMLGSGHDLMAIAKTSPTIIGRLRQDVLQRKESFDVETSWNTPGTYYLYCSVHQNMKLTVIVQ